MGLKALLGISDSPSERLIKALESLAAVAERGAKGFRSTGPPKKLSRDSPQVFYTNDEEEAVAEMKRFTYEQHSGREIGAFEDTPGPEDPRTGLPWGEEPPEAKEGRQEDGSEG